ncbi:MAG: trigger factor [bacterium]|nr:trigger factor [bacterium]
MSYTIKTLAKSQVEIQFTIPPADYKHAMETAAVTLSERAAIKGFRPGKAPYDIVKSQLGEQKIMEEALEGIVQTNYFKTVQTEKLDTVGYPQISIEKMAPGNDLVFKAVAAILPAIKLPDLATITVEKKSPVADTKQADEIIGNLKKMQRKEIAKAEAATKDDKMVIDMEMFIDKVPMEGGQAKGHQVYLSEDHYIPGLAGQLIGLKKDETKEFTLPFPKDHYQKQFAGKNVDVKVKVTDVFSLEYPELTDEFAKSLGQASMAKLTALIQNNILEEAKHKEEERLEIEMLEKIVTGSTFGELPEVLITAEKEKMFNELKHSLEQQGLTMEQYLKDVKKTEEQIATDFTEQATKRAKAALASRQIAKENNITVTPEEMAEEKKRLIASYGDDERIQENLKRPDVLATISVMIQNRKVVAWLKEKILKDSK